MTTVPAGRGQRAGLAALAGLLGAAAVALALGWWAWPVPPDVPELPSAGGALVGLDSGRTFLAPSADFEAPGIDRPPAVPAADAALADNEAVVGVSAGGRRRAYSVRALARTAESHIVNDVLDGVPVSVTYCDIYRCTRVFTGGPPGEPLDLSQGGLTDGGMVLKSGSHTYRQDSGEALEPGGSPLRYGSLPCEETTWGAWRHAHPDTDVYTGEPNPAAQP